MLINVIIGIICSPPFLLLAIAREDDETKS